MASPTARCAPDATGLFLRGNRSNGVQGTARGGEPGLDPGQPLVGLTAVGLGGRQQALCPVTVGCARGLQIASRMQTRRSRLKACVQLGRRDPELGCQLLLVVRTTSGLGSTAPGAIQLRHASGGSSPHGGVVLALRASGVPRRGLLGQRVGEGPFGLAEGLLQLRRSLRCRRRQLTTALRQVCRGFVAFELEARPIAIEGFAVAGEARFT